MSNHWCLHCGKTIALWEEKCPYCGTNQFGENNEYAPDAKSYDMARKALYGTPQKVRQKKKEPMFTDLQILMFGLYPKGFKEILKLKVFWKKRK